MPYPRPALSDLRAQVASDLTSGLKTVDGLLRFSNLGILGTSVAGLSHQHYGYLAWIAKQATPYTATGEILEAWAALKSVYREAATFAELQATFMGAVGSVIPQGTQVARSDGVYYVTTADATVGSAGTLVVNILASDSGTGSNADIGTLVTLASVATGIQSSGAVTALVGLGTEVETDDSLRTRMLAAYQAKARGGAQDDYTLWALNCTGVTRAWVKPLGAGPGTVVVYVMFDAVNASNNGFPVGRDGLSALDNRATAASVAIGNQLAVANELFASQPVTPLVFICAPAPAPVDFTITGLATSTTGTRQAIAQAIAQVMIDQGEPVEGSSVDLSAIESAIAAISGTSGFVITSPAGNIANQRGYLPTLGVVTYG
ncbi:baseplate J/gp47 family protein [Pseudomonas lurida]|uniref:baseplate J/gp47 family protein n=1 Tax=Pseudomonas lurida TaxID=244566 RepID=UPI001656D79B|nr:baseplate J/gp47 family protein [Pseudomonas lurida]MBC8984101.1 baseplate J/gp47 family protein [Pseudomonas lurida]